MKECYRLQFVKSHVPWRTTTQRMDSQDQVKTDLAVEKFMQAKIIERCASYHQSKQFLSKFFTLQDITNSGLQEIKSIYTSGALQNRGNSSVTRGHWEGRFYSKVGFKRCVHCGPHPQGFKPIFSLWKPIFSTENRIKFSASASETFWFWSLRSFWTTFFLIVFKMKYLSREVVCRFYCKPFNKESEDICIDRANNMEEVDYVIKMIQQNQC